MKTLLGLHLADNISRQVFRKPLSRSLITESLEFNIKAGNKSVRAFGSAKTLKGTIKKGRKTIFEASLKRR